MDIKSEKLFLIEQLLKTSDTYILRKVRELLTQKQVVEEQDIAGNPEKETNISSDDLRKKLESSEFNVKKNISGKKTRNMSQDELDREIENW